MKQIISVAVVLASLVTQQVNAALTVDRSRVIYNEGEKSVSVNVANVNKHEPYLAQAWIEDEQEKKSTSQIMALPPVQRIEADARSIVRIQAMPDLNTLPQDRESIFYFNLREIPPKTKKNNVLMLAMQTRLKVFYRPKTLVVDRMADVVPGVKQLTISREGEKLVVNNPTPYHFTFVELRQSVTGKNIDKFEPAMISPLSKLTLNIAANKAGAEPVLVFVNDYGSQRILPFSCDGRECKAKDVILPQKIKGSDNHEA